jgi:curved DNA-binding protein CbpA
MGSFIDYYAILGVEPGASLAQIKAAFKKLALRYHPDVYKGSDAEERMRLILEAYQTLNDAKLRQAYDRRRAQELGLAAPRSATTAAQTAPSRAQEVSPQARRDRRRHYAFPDLDGPTTLYLGELIYSLSAEQAATLQERGLLRGNIAGGTARDQALHLRADLPAAARRLDLHYCHRCHHRWSPPASTGERGAARGQACPRCHARDWAEYLLLHCLHCHAVFESEQIRYEIGSYRYGGGDLCPPYELFPLCPYCGRARWCPAEEERVERLRAAAARRRGLFFLLALSLLLVAVLALSVIALTALAR